MGIYTKVATDGGKWVEIGTDGSVGADLLGGVAGWAAIESVSGSTDLATLKANNIAPASATEDVDCPGTYNITADGVVWRVAVFTNTSGVHDLTTSGDGLVEVLLVGGGQGHFASTFAGMFGDVVYGLHKIKGKSHSIKIGLPGGDNMSNSDKTKSYFGAIETRIRVGTQRADPLSISGAQLDHKSSITGKECVYATYYSGENAPGRGSHGSGTGREGIVVVRAPKDAANNPKPDVSMPWGDFTTNGDEDDSGEWGPDGEGRTWKWAEWNDSTKTPTVNLTGGLYWVLTVNGGNTYKSNNGGGEHNGRPGDVFEGYWEFPTNSATPITVGKAGGPGALSASTAAGGSKIGGYGSQTWGSRWGDASSGMGNQNPGSTGSDGYKSMIRGSQGEFSTAVQGAAVPGRAGTSSASAKPGCVIIATVTNDPSEWNPPGALPGIGGWATVQSITGPAGKRYTYNDGPGGVGGTDWVAYEWTDGGSFTVTDGIIETLTVGSGGYGAGGGGVGTVATGGVVLHTLQQAAAGTFSLSVAPAASSVGETPANGSASTINFDIPMTATGGFNGGSVSAFPPAFDGYEMLITGESMWCGGNSVSTKTGPGFGGASRPYKAGKAGVVIIRVPAANALATIPGTWGDL